MHILISQIEYIKPPRMVVFDALERIYYDFLAPHKLIPVPNAVKVPDIDYDCLVITGGPDSVNRNKTENMLYDHAIKNSKPIIGICHGAFVINDINGGVNGRIDGHIDTEHTIKMYGKEYRVNSYHSQSIEKLADNFVTVATDQEGNTEAFKHQSLPIYGMLWHPERMPGAIILDEVKKLLD